MIFSLVIDFACRSLDFIGRIDIETPVPLSALANIEGGGARPLLEAGDPRAGDPSCPLRNRAAGDVLAGECGLSRENLLDAGEPREGECGWFAPLSMLKIFGLPCAVLLISPPLLLLPTLLLPILLLSPS